MQTSYTVENRLKPTIIELCRTTLSHLGTPRQLDGVIVVNVDGKDVVIKFHEMFRQQELTVQPSPIHSLMASHRSRKRSHCQQSCSYCGFQSRDILKLHKHLVMHKNVGATWTCTLCQIGFADPVFYGEHVTTMHSSIQAPIFQCVLCPQIPPFRTIGELEEHEADHADRTNKTFQIPQKRTRDYSPNSPNSTSSTDEPINLSTKNDTVVLNGSEQEEKLYDCEFCSTPIRGFAAFDDHCRRLHQRYPCSYCGKSLTQKGNRDRHVRLHTGERPYR